ncbi:hypothetical protein ACS0TY_028610 [Phlomoides rotata]
MEDEIPLLGEFVRSSIDFKGRPSLRSNSGCWNSASFIIGFEMAERFAHYGISSNLVSYLTGKLGLSTATAAANVNVWSGTTSLTPILGAFIADSFLGRYRSVIVASLLYVLGLGFLSISAGLNRFESSQSTFHIIFFFFALYLVALAEGGHMPSLEAFGADQFDEEDVNERESKSSFFNWWTFCLCFSVLVSLLVMSYIQDNLSWELGFGIPCIVMFLALIVFLLGSGTFRFRIKSDEANPFVRICHVFMTAAKNWQASPAVVSQPHEGSHFRFLDKALLEPTDPEGISGVCSINDVEDAKAILKLLPISLTCLPYAIIYSQSSTLFTKQGATMDRYITASFQIPAAALQSCIAASIVLFIPIYDRVLVPIARAINQQPSGISMLQRIGTGVLLSSISMTIAGFTERKRLATASEYGLMDLPDVTVPMSVWWLAPQYIVLGVAESFTLIGLQEFFYDQVPDELKSMGLALCFGVTGIGNFLSSFLIYVVDKTTSNGHGHESWFSDNLNRAHLDYFYWLLASLNAISLALYIYFAKSYVYKHRRVTTSH